MSKGVTFLGNSQYLFNRPGMIRACVIVSIRNIVKPIDIYKIKLINDNIFYTCCNKYGYWHVGHLSAKQMSALRKANAL